MKSLILFASKYGSTKRSAESLSEILVDAEIYSVSEFKGNINDFELIVLGFPIIAGQVEKSMRKFVDANLPALKTTRLYMFFTCWDETSSRVVVENQLLSKLSAISVDCIGGEITYESMHEMEQQIIKDITGVGNSQSNMSLEKIDAFAKKIKEK